MKYDLQNPSDQFQAQTKLDYFKSKGYFIEMKRVLPKRTHQQNAYLHLILGWFAIEYGETLEYSKQYFFKRACNPEMFITEYENRKTGEVRKTLRSSADLDTLELTTAIERFRNWSAAQGIYLPTANEGGFLRQIECEMEKNKEYI